MVTGCASRMFTEGGNCLLWGCGAGLLFAAVEVRHRRKEGLVDASPRLAAASSDRGDDRDGVVAVGGVDRSGCRVDGHVAGRASGRELWLGAAAAGGDGGVAGRG